MKGIPKLRTYIFLLFFCSFFYETASAQWTAVPFLLVPPSARISAMGESGVALADDASAAFLNPAGLGFQTGQEVNLSYTRWLPLFYSEKPFYGNGNYRINVPQIGGTVAAALTYFNFGEIHDRSSADVVLPSYSNYEYAFCVSYGTTLASEIGVGLGIRFIRSTLSPAGVEPEISNITASVISGDIGILYKPSHIIIPFTQIDLEKRFGIGLALTNMGPSVSYIDEAQSDPIPTNLRVGIAFNLIQSESHKVTWTFDVNKPITSRTKSKADPFFTALTKTWTTFSDGSKKNISDIMREVNFGTGVEYTFSDFIALRGGYFYEDPDMGNRRMFTFGAGIRYDIFGLDLSYIALYGKYTDRTPAKETFRLTANVNWDKDTSK